MKSKTIHRIFAAVVFIITFFVYLSTVQRTVSFWDCGEFIASAYQLQVPHPPGTPFFLILGRLFSMIPFAENIGLRVNLISVISSAFTILFLYLIAVKVIENFRKKNDDSLGEKIITYLAAAIGALSLAFSDTFWFNSAEAEVYAFSTFFIALVTWLMMVWNEKADEPDSEKYLILITYLIGLSTGVHLMAVLATVSVVMIVMIRKYLTDEEVFKKTSYIFLGHTAAILFIAVIMWGMSTDTNAPSPEQFRTIDQRFILVFAGVSVLIMGAFWKKIFQKNSFYLPLIFGGIALFTIYPGIVKVIPNLIAAIGKNNDTISIILFVGLFAVTGYLIYFTNKKNKKTLSLIFLIFGGIALITIYPLIVKVIPNLIAENNDTISIILFVGLFAITGYLIYFTKKKNKETLSLIFKCILLALIGYTSAAMIIIRSNLDTPINLNSPKTMPEFVSYINREQYGDFPTFKRRFSYESKNAEIYTNYSSDLDFLWRYQVNHMFNRYWLWNYAGRVSTVQDDGVDWSKLFGIPFFIGLFGMYYHFRRDWKMGWVFLVMFIFLGYLTLFYQNQQEPQPRERDYFYVGAYFVFSMWIAIGIRGLIDLIKEKLQKPEFNKIINVTILGLSFIFVPLNMFKVNYHEHDRSKDYLPWDSAYNMLQSVEKDAVLFTYGDNDTFPLWYIQDVEGVRRDVRIACLALLNTPWYIKQLKNTEPYGSKKVEMSLTDRELDQISPVRWEPRDMDLEVPLEIFKEYGVTDTSIINKGKITWKMPNTAQFGNTKVITVQDIAVLDMIITNNWKRPIYFASTTSETSRLGFEDYLQLEGFAFRLVPKKRTEDESYYVNESIMRKQLLAEPKTYSKDYQPGFLYRGLDDPTIFYDDNHARLIGNYRNSFIRLALYYYAITQEDNKVIEVLDAMEQKMPRTVLSLDYRIKHDIAKIYFNVGADIQYKELAYEVINSALDMLQKNPNNFSGWYNPYQLLLTHYENLKEYNKAIEILLRLQALVPDDSSVKNVLDRFRRLARQDSSETIPKTE